MVTAMLVSFLASSVAIAPVAGISSGAGAAGYTRTAWPPSIGSVVAVANQPDAPEPAVRVTLNSQNVFDPGDRARVHVHVRDDSYLVVLYAAPDGRVRMLYPIYPHDDDFVKAGTDFDVRATEEDATYSFVVDPTGGEGMVYAAVSQDPYRFDAFMSGGNWTAAAFPTGAQGSAAEQVMTDLVQRMANPAGRFDYDIADYSVTNHGARQPQTYASTDDFGSVFDDGGGGSTTVIYAPAYSPWGYGYGYGYGGYDPFWFGIGFAPWAAIGWGGCWGGCYGGYYGGYGYGGGYYGGGYYGPHVPLAYRPGVPITPIGYRPRGVYAGGDSVYPGHLGGTPWQGHGAASSAVFGNAHSAAGGSVGYRVPGGSYRVPGGSGQATVFRHVQSVGPAAQPGTGRVVTQGDRVSGAPNVGGAHAVRATPVGPSHYSAAPAGRVSVAVANHTAARTSAACKPRRGGSSPVRNTEPVTVALRA